MSDKRNVMVIGGYGAVGTEVCTELAKDGNITVIVGGRNADKARVLAERIGVTWREVDALDPASVKRAMADVSVVINCFIDLTSSAVHVAQAAVDLGACYLDVAAVPLGFNQRVLALAEQAAANKATLITALGANPGIPALLVCSNTSIMQSVTEVDIFFVMGSRMDGLSVLSLQGVGQMIQTPAKEWRSGDWSQPAKASCQRIMGEPYNHKVYFGPSMITADLVDVPRRVGARRFTFWSGMEEMLHSMVFLAGIKLGQTRTPRKAERFSRLLKWVASNKAHHDCLLEMVATGMKDGKPVKRSVSLRDSEERLTAIAPVVVCRQYLAGEITKHGAFVAPDAVPVDSFVERLKSVGVHFQEQLSSP